MKVMIIPEDPVLDGYILKPIVQRLFAELGKAPRIDVLTHPRIRGVAEALSPTQIDDIVETYPMVDLFLVMVDRDGDENRFAEARGREEQHPDRLFVCLAIEEIEVWMLAAHRDSLGDSWSTIRAEPHPKERFALPFLVPHEYELGKGRAWAMRALKSRWKGVLEVCQELEELARRLQGWLVQRA